MDTHLNVLRTSLTNLLSGARMSILEGQRRASVALILRIGSERIDGRSSKCLEVLFIQRAVRDSDPWSADIAFPGGRRSAEDESDYGTVVRETQEEVGLVLGDNSHAYIGQLNDQLIHRTAIGRNDVLCVFVFMQTAPVPLTSDMLQREEVNSVFWIPLRYLHGGTQARCAYERKVPCARLGFIGRSAPWLVEFSGLTRLQMPAIDILPLAKDMVYANEEYVDRAPYVPLWGLTLSCLGDFVQCIGGRRVDWLGAIPGNRALQVVSVYITDVYWWMQAKIYGDKFEPFINNIELFPNNTSSVK